MEADWDEVARITLAPPAPQSLPTPVTTLAFDTEQELLWAGNEYGRISSHYGPELSRYTSYRGHPPAEGSVRQLLFHERGVVSVSSRSIHLSSRQGLAQWHLTHDHFVDLHCMSFINSPNRILVAGTQPRMFIIDVERGQILDSLETDWGYIIMRKGRYICAATDTGFVNVLDLSSFKIVKSWTPHGTAINDMDVHNDFLVTCGYSIRQTGQPIVDPLANVYDLKSMKPISPVPFHAGAAFIRMLTNMQTTAVVASQTGQLQLVDLMNPHTANVRQANISSYMLTLAMAPSGQALAIADSEGSIHLWGSPSKIRFSIQNKETEFASPPARATYVDWNNSPLSLVGMPYYHEKLLSAWPSHLVFEVGAPPTQIDSSVIPHLRPFEIGQYAPNPKKKHRYQIENTRMVPQSEALIAAPKFLSEKAREPASQPGKRVSDATEALANTSLDTNSEDVLLKYSNVEIKYSKFGVDDFDFKFYNKTAFSGLETHIANSFLNSLLQLLKFIPLVRNLALHHAATSCIFEHCLLCELGFLFDMLDKAKGQNCQATNLLKTFNSFREASNLGLLEENLASKSLSTTIQGVNRFFLTQISNDFRQSSPNLPDAEHILATSAAEAIRCIYCRTETVRPGEVFVHELHYPQDQKSSSRGPKFSQLLKASIERETHSRGWCNKCRRYQQLVMHKTIHRMPLVLMINAALNNPSYCHLWATKDWLPREIGILVDGGHVFCFEGEDLRLRKRSTPELILYDLVGFVSEIDFHENSKPHLVSLINVNISSRDATADFPASPAMSQWHLFNDFLVQPVSGEEALMFGQSWKIPCVLSYQVQSARHAVDETWKDNLDTTLLYFEWSLNHQRPFPSCRVLDGNTEAPAPGTHIALDTEFVDLEKAEIDIKADGTQEMIRPSRSGLARVSVLRGSGEREGVPFIDDYIVIKEPIVDYVTQYSGIRPGDLDPRTSRHNLVPLKVAYKKLWLLLNLGCTFVGHGLSSDFRKINIKVPKDQTVDTQYLFFHPTKNRRLSLRYLAWAVFREYIQEDNALGGPSASSSTTTATAAAAPEVTGDITTAAVVAPSSLSLSSSLSSSSPSEGHDSIEDARMALRLWRKFREYDDAGVVGQVLEDIFREGAKVGFRPPVRRKKAGVAGGAAIGPPEGGDIITPGRNTPDLGGVIRGSAPGTPSKGFRLGGPVSASASTSAIGSILSGGEVHGRPASGSGVRQMGMGMGSLLR